MSKTFAGYFLFALNSACKSIKCDKLVLINFLILKKQTPINEQKELFY